MKTWDRLSGAVLLLVAVAWGYESSRLPLGQPSLPGPGFQPLWAAAVLGLLALALTLLIAYALALSAAGYLLATGGVLAAFLLLERQRWPVVVGVALVSALTSYWLFAVWLQVPLPRGLLGW